MCRKRKTKVILRLSTNVPYSEPATVPEIIKTLERLQEQLAIMIESLGSNHVIEDGNLKDVRIATLKECKHDISTNIVFLNVFMAKETGYMSEAEWIKVFGIQSKDTSLPVIERRIRHFLQLSLVTLYQFRIENLITNILAILDKERAKDAGYYNKVKALLDILGLKYKDTKLKKLNVLAFVRNSLHSGGVTNRYELDVTIDGYRFNFRKGEKVKYAGWGHIALAMESSLVIINEILHSDKVKAIPEPISTMYIDADLENV